MRNFIVGVLFFVIISFQVKAQKNGDGFSKNILGHYYGTYIVPTDNILLEPELHGSISKNESENEQELKELKERLQLQKQDYIKNNGTVTISNKTTANEPILVSGFSTIPNPTVTPPDNSASINADGQIVTIINNTIKIYNTVGVSLASTRSLSSFFSPLGTALLTNSICDPKVFYDNQVNKFIVFAQTCDGNSSTSQCLFAFSQTSNPTGAWNYYAFTGDPFNQNEWFDYPKLGVSDHDVFVTGNLFSDVGGYTRSIIYQIDKLKCFAGATLTAIDSKVWYNITGTPFTMVPMSNGRQGGYGNNMYLACKGSAKIKLYEISNSVQNNPTITLTNVTIPSNSAPADAPQLNSTKLLDVGDGRAMDGYYLNGTIHFVFHSDGGNGFSAINYTRLLKSGTTWTATNNIIKETGIDMSYPSIASIGFDNIDQSSLISYNYCSPTEMPGIKAVYSSHNFTVSNPILLKVGEGPVELGTSTSTVARWGDYSACAKDYGASLPTVWSFACYGNAGKYWSNRVSQVTTSIVPLATTPIEKQSTNATIFPNPSIPQQRTQVKINIPIDGILHVDMYTMQGQIVQNIYHANSPKGDNDFSFNTSTFAIGNYVLKFSLNNTEIASKKITIK